MAGNSTLYLLFDFLVALTIVFLEIALHVSIYGTQSGLWPHKKGFFCDDKSIQMPYKEDTINWTTVLCVGFIATIVTIMIYEIGNRYCNWRQDAESEEDEEKETCGPISLKSWYIRMISTIIIFVSAALATEVICELLKLASGELRPNFLAVCQPDTRIFDCRDGYITNASVCTGDLLKVKNARLSFPSSHSAAAMYFALFYAFYIQAIVVVDTKLLKPLIQMVVVSLALLTGVSRIMDYRHHLLDVLTGFILGAFVAWFTAFKILKLFAFRIRKPRVYTLVPQTKDDPE